MKPFKTTFLYFLLISAFVSILYSGCEPVDENTTSDDPRTQYLGEWIFLESSKSTESQSYLVSITEDLDNSAEVILENFANAGPGITVKGIVTSTKIVITSQKMSNGWQVEGNGEMANVVKTSMSWDYSALIGGDFEEHHVSATRN